MIDDNHFASEAIKVSCIYEFRYVKVVHLVLVIAYMLM